VVSSKDMLWALLAWDRRDRILVALERFSDPDSGLNREFGAEHNLLLVDL
jgi:hypothetical protein